MSRCVGWSGISAPILKLVLQATKEMVRDVGESRHGMLTEDEPGLPGLFVEFLTDGEFQVFETIGFGKDP